MSITTNRSMRRLGVALVALIAAVGALSACSPSGNQVEIATMKRSYKAVTGYEGNRFDCTGPSPVGYGNNYQQTQSYWCTVDRTGVSGNQRRAMYVRTTYSNGDRTAVSKGGTNGWFYLSCTYTKSSSGSWGLSGSCRRITERMP